MHNRIGFNRLDRKPSHRKALKRNMALSLFQHERIKTTETKAKEIRRFIEKIITKAKVDSVHTRRIVAKEIQSRSILHKLFTEIAPSYSERPGGYTRILKLGKRAADSTEMVYLELVDRYILPTENEEVETSESE